MDSVNRDPILVDTGPLVAIFSRSDEHHQLCLDQMRKCGGPLLTCWPVITEAAWLLQNYSDAVRTLLSALNNDPLQLLMLTDADLRGVSEIVKKYEDLRIQLADACLVHLANRERIETVFTLDRRDFSVLRRTGGKKLRIIP